MLPIATLSISTLLAGAALVMAFFKRLPAVAVAYVAMLVASASDMVTFTSSQMWFWGVAVVIALGIQYAVGDGGADRARRLYTVGGTLAGAVVGLALGTQAAVIVAAAVGALMGYMAFSLTPAGRRAAGPRLSLNALAAIGLPAVVNFAILMLIFAQLLIAK